ncbi:PREDICTED: uncharacterized protein LOC106297383 [Brassica oleracea var. oleracea]|uniref:uncharacterized protein LOC106297383 n=1 Tax=Brassica oleracea var. oleracea TaxID=109376 RepID=UPI0006A6D271|nr:PREDICTED: uncharacterized protein LOC106297383 [Brassica oleracea var. oleracea]
MADVKDEIETSSKGTGPSSIKFPMLTSSNYTVWAMKMRIALKVNEVGNLETAKTVWDAIQARHVGAERVRDARLQTLMADFDKHKMKEDDRIDTFIGKLAEISSKTASLGEVNEEPKLVKKFLKSLPRKKYIHMVESLEQVLDLNTTSFEDIIGRLKAYEERIAVKLSKKVMVEEEDVDDEVIGEVEEAEDVMEASTHKGKHISKDKTETRCPDAKLKLQETVEKKVEDTQEADELMMHEVVYLNEKKVKPSIFEDEENMENVWYLDNGASNHMSGNRMFFYSLDKGITGKVRLGDDSRIDIKGKGSIKFVLKGGEKKTLSNVYYVPGLRSNIVSLGQATEAGC